MPWVYDENNENANPNARVKTHFESFNSIIETPTDNIKNDLMKIFEKSTLNELEKMYKHSNLQNNKHTDAYEDAAKMLDTYIELHKDDEKMTHPSIKHHDEADNRINIGINSQLKNIVDNANSKYKSNLTKKQMNQINHHFVRDLMELIENSSQDNLDNLIHAYQFTLYPHATKQGCPVKPGYDAASKILDDYLEEKGISRDECGNVYHKTREFGTPYDLLLHRKTTHRKTTSHRGGSYKKRRSRPLKKSRRVKRRKTNATRKSRK